MKKVLFILAAAISAFTSMADARTKDKAITVDDQLPAGNIIVHKVSADTVYVDTDLRDTGRFWFYWGMRVKGAEGKTLVFSFSEKSVGARGPVVSSDKGKTYRYSGGKYGNTFTYTFGSKEKEVWFYECHPYLPKDWTNFTKGLSKKMFKADILCKTRSGNEIPMATFGNLSGNAKYKIVMTGRHHASESIANFAMEGIIENFCADSELGRWLRDNVELSVVPFVDYDGVINGDQGKGRKPHDHNNDYAAFIYPETKAVSELFTEKQPVIILDMHCPWIAGKNSERVYCPMLDPQRIPDNEAEDLFSKIVEKNASGLPYKTSNNLPFGVSWNKSTNYTSKLSCRKWAVLNIKSLRICRCFEIPFANAQGVEVNPESTREFGRSLAISLAEFLQTVK